MTTRGIDFQTLTLKDALDLAVLIEEEARDRYEELAEQLHETHAAAAFFTKLSRIEEIHRKQLEHKRRDQFGKAPSGIASSSLLDDAEAPSPAQVHPGMSAQDALAIALRSEEKAHAFFVHALTLITDADARALFSSLRDEELEHQRLVKAEMARLAASNPPASPTRSP